MTTGSPTLIGDGFTLLAPLEATLASSEWERLEYLDWKSGGDTRFAPITSATGELECNGFWERGKADADGVWTSNAPLCPALVAWVRSVGAPYGRVRVIELQPNTYEEAVRELHLDGNNRLNPAGSARIVRVWLQLTDDPQSRLLLRSELDDPTAEVQIPLPRGTQFVVDSERLYHAVWHPGERPRIALIASFTTTPAFESWIARNRLES